MVTTCKRSDLAQRLHRRDAWRFLGAPRKLSPTRHRPLLATNARMRGSGHQVDRVGHAADRCGWVEGVRGFVERSTPELAGVVIAPTRHVTVAQPRAPE